MVDSLRGAVAVIEDLAARVETYAATYGEVIRRAAEDRDVSVDVVRQLVRL